MNRQRIFFAFALTTIGLIIFVAINFLAKQTSRPAASSPGEQAGASESHDFQNVTANNFAAKPQDIFDNQDWRQERRSRYGNQGSRRYRMREMRKPLLKWENQPGFTSDVFTFARIQYTSYQRYGRYRWGRPDWTVDMPDSDNNFSFRLQQLTSLKVHFEPEGAVVVQLDNDKIFDYPFCYLIEPGQMSLTQPEVVGMRKYLSRGGFIMVDDFWGDDEWYNFRDEIKRVFPKLDFVELGLDHEIFNIVYKLDKKPQIPSIGHYYRGWTTERSDAEAAHYWGLYDEDGRMMMIVCHNTDLGDGWEREGMDAGYFKTYSEPFAYPLGINIVTYALTH
jgi:hypothetical protein